MKIISVQLLELLKPHCDFGSTSSARFCNLVRNTHTHTHTTLHIIKQEITYCAVLFLQRQYISYIEGQNVKLVNMLDPKAKWPKGRESYPFGLTLLDIAKLATTVDYKQRPEISPVSGHDN